MSKITFVYEGLADEYENGKKIEYSFGDSERDLGLTTYDMCDHFEYFLKAIGYHFKGKVLIEEEESK